MSSPVPQETSSLIARDVRGTYAGIVVFVGIAVLNLSNAAFHLIAARDLGPADYSEVVSLLALSGIVGLPLTALQVLVARYVAGDAARGQDGAIAGVTRRTLAAAGALSLVITAGLLALTPLIQQLLSIDSPIPVILTALITPPALMAPVLFGLAQGLQRFGVLTLAIGLGAITRLLILLGLIGAGLSVNGALMATLIGSAVALASPLIPLRRWLRPMPITEPIPSVRELTRAVIPIAMGMLAITSLTTADLIIAKVALPDADAGIYGSASLIGRLLLYVPATVATVLLPKVSSRAAANRNTSDILGASLGVTAVISTAGLLLFLAAPTTIVDASFGSRFDAGSSLLGLFGVSMTGYALLNILLIYHLGHGSARMSWLLLIGAVVQLIGYSVFHQSGKELLAVEITVAIALLIAHEVLIERSAGFVGTWVRNTVARR
jgi:O-antigen/teichoic acid export membrane protein